MQNTTLPLRDIHLPETIGWWPPAIGWWLLAILVCIAVALLVYWFRLTTRKTAIKTAQKQLVLLKQNTALDERQKIIELSALLRRVAISQMPRAKTAGLTGQAWLAYLDRPFKDAPFRQGIGSILANGPYQPHSPSADQVNALLALAEKWLKQCHKLNKPSS